MANVSILEIRQGLIKVKASYGDRQLGGDDWDEQIVDWLVNEFKKKTGIDLRFETQALQRLREAAEKAKIELSIWPETEINLPFITADLNGPRHLHLQLARSKFEQLTEPLVERCRTLLAQTLKEAGLHAGDFDQVILMGGATKMPMIRDLMPSLTGQISNEQINPSTAVAQGAAILGDIYEAKQVRELDNFLRTLLHLGGNPFEQSQRERQSRTPQAQVCNYTVQITLAEAFFGTTRTLLWGDGRRVEVKIPSGAHSGLCLRLSGQGKLDLSGRPLADFYLTVEVAPHPIFQRVNDDLHITLPIDLHTALLGGQVEVSSLDRSVKLTIPPETTAGQIFRLRGLGMPQLGQCDQRGDLYATIEVQLPQGLSPEEKELLQKWRELRKWTNQEQDGKGHPAEPQNSPSIHAGEDNLSIS
jgi:hypothetical protein